MRDYDLDDLLSALNEVASSSDPDSDSHMDPNDDPDAGDFDPNDDPDNVDDPEDVEDDPRSYTDDDDDENDYSRKPAIVMRLRKLEAEAGQFGLPRMTRSRAPKKPMSKTDQSMSKIANLREKTSKINLEIETDKLLAAETKKHKNASVASYLADLSPEQKREHDQNMRRIAEHYSARYPDVAASWREDATAVFRNKRLS